MRKSVFFLLLLCFVPAVSGAEAAMTDLPTGSVSTTLEDSIRNAGLSNRLNYLEKVLTYNERHAGNWWKTWTALYGVATVGQGVVAVVSTDRSTRQDLWLGAGTTALGVVSQLVTPVSTGFEAIGPDSVAQLTSSAKEKLLEVDEGYLKRQSDIAVAGKSWQTHALSGAVNLASGLITWIGFKRSLGEGVLNFALNTVVTEAQIWTQPIWAKQHYRQIMWNLHEEGFRPNADRIPEWYGLAGPGGFCIGLRF